MSNVAIMREYLQDQNVVMEEVQENDGGVFFRTRQGFDNGGSVVVVIAFNEREDLVDLQLYGIASIKDPLKKEAVHNFINELNVNYRFAKYMEVEGDISAQYSFHLEENKINPAYVVDSLLMLIRTAEENYPKFMKLQWA
ncbi:YbjN domain-containing protein [Alkalihalophilus marmarensis]|uniref:YbjN domain-containing protein n=1 Tax=Alkalihalophilus marmarensis TaxID=521377 RepID=UPI002E24375B|nr:YbjN domain-containing protein [Alkalihalophilus marmarensis]